MSLFGTDLTMTVLYCKIIWLDMTGYCSWTTDWLKTVPEFWIKHFKILQERWNDCLENLKIYN